MIDRHLARLRARHSISDAEERAIRGAISGERSYPAEYVFIQPRQLLTYSTILLDGLICRFKDLRDGQRQISELHVPGDLADLHSYALKRLDHGIMALTDARVAILPHENLRDLMRDYPHLADVFLFQLSLDAAIHREWMVSLGRRSALARMAALFCELRVRLDVVGLADAAGFALELTQIQLAECLGITVVHVNRTLRELRERGLVTLRNRRVTIQDLARLEHLAEFDAAYLYLERQLEPA